MWVLTGAFTLVAAGSLIGLLEIRQPRLYILNMLFWPIFIMAGSILVAGMLGILKPWGVAATSIGICLVGMLCCPWSMNCAVENAGALWPAVRKMAGNCPGAFLVAVCMGSMLALRQWIYVWFFPPHVYDVLTYHLPKVADWIQSGALAANPTPVVRSFWPANFELVQAWFVVFIHHDIVVELAGVPFWLLGTFSVFSICRSLRTKTSSALWGGLAYLCVPVVFQNAVSGKNDIAVAGLFLFVVALLLEWRNHRWGDMSILLPVASAMCLAIGTKPTILFMGPAFLLWAVCVAPWRKFDVPSMDFHVHPARTRIGIVLGIMMLLSAVLALYWYVRNWMLFGNPFHPTDFKLFGILIAGDGHGTGQQGGFSLAAALDSLSDVWRRRALDPGQYSPDVGFMTGWGWLSFALGIPCTIIMVFFNKKFALLAGMFVGAGLLLLSFVQYDPWNMRFLQWFPALFCVGFALLLDNIHFDSVRNGVKWLAVICLMMNFLGTINNGWFTLDDWRYFIATPWRERSVRTGYEKAWEFVPEGKVIGYFLGPNDPVYVLRGPGYERSAEYLIVDPQTRDFAAAADKQKLQYVLYPDLARDPEWRVPFMRQCEEGKFTYLRDGLYVRSNSKAEQAKDRRCEHVGKSE